MKTIRSFAVLAAALYLVISWAHADSEVAGLERLVERLLGGPMANGASVTLFVGALPEELALQLPLPEGAEVLGGMVRLDTDASRFAQVIAEIARPASDAMDEAVRLLTQQDWQVRSQHMQGGFVSAGANRFVELCSPINDTFVYVNAFHVADSSAELRYDLSDSPYFVCGDEPMWQPHEPVPLPQLITPQGLSHTFLGTHWNVEEAASNARMLGDSDVSTLLQEFARQLELQGWRQQLGQSEGAVAWGLWDYTDTQGRDWNGAISLIAPQHEEFLASFVVVPAQAHVSE